MIYCPRTRAENHTYWAQVRYNCSALCSKYGVCAHFGRGTNSLMRNFFPIGTNSLLCPLHISRSDAPIGLRCSRRQFGTKPSDVASAHHSHWPNSAQCVHSRRLVRGSRTILYDSLVGMVKESYLVQLSVALYTFGSRSAGVTK